MFERFTDRARQAISLAEEEARALHHNYIGTEHLLLGLIAEGEGVAARALESLGISLDGVRRQVERIIGQGQQEPQEHISYTPRATKVLELASREAKALGHNYIGTEHLLLGLVREGHGVAAQVLTALGADLNRVRQQIILVLHEHQGQPSMTMPAGARFGRSRWKMRGREAEIREHVEAIGSQLAAIEQRLGGGPELGDLDRQIGQARRAKEAAAGAEDYETATAERDRERQLLAEKAGRQAEWAAAHPELSAVAEALHRLSDEVGRLRGLLDEPGIEPRDGAA